MAKRRVTKRVKRKKSVSRRVRRVHTAKRPAMAKRRAGKKLRTIGKRKVRHIARPMRKARPARHVTRKKPRMQRPLLVRPKTALVQRSISEIVEYGEHSIGTVTHYYGHLNVGIISLAEPLRVGDQIHVKGHSTDFLQTVESIQIDHQTVAEASAGQIIGIKLSNKVRDGDRVFLTKSM